MAGFWPAISHWRIVKRRDDGARAGAGAAAAVCQVLQCCARAVQLLDFCVQSGDTAGGQFKRAGSVIDGVECDQFTDLVECEARGLRRSYEPQTAHIRRGVAADAAAKTGAAGARRLGHQPATLVIANGLDTDADGLCEFGNGHVTQGLTPYHGTDRIWGVVPNSASWRKAMANDLSPKTAALYRMVMEGHTCPYGLKAKDLLRRKGYEVVDHWLTSRAEVDRLKKDLNVATTPQIFIGDTRVGGFDDLRRYLDLSVPDPKVLTYRPVLAIFAVTLLMAAAVSHAVYGTVLTVRAGEWFVSFSMAVLALMKLRDVESFATMFLNYDLLARRWVPYSYVYPYAELLAGILMIANVAMWLSVPVALFIGTIGAVSVFKAVYIEGRELKCACVGGDTKVPLGFVSLTENLFMIAMAIWMIFGRGLLSTVLSH